MFLFNDSTRGISPPYSSLRKKIKYILKGADFLPEDFECSKNHLKISEEYSVHVS